MPISRLKGNSPATSMLLDSRGYLPEASRINTFSLHSASHSPCSRGRRISAIRDLWKLYPRIPLISGSCLPPRRATYSTSAPSRFFRREKVSSSHRNCQRRCRNIECLNLHVDRPDRASNSRRRSGRQMGRLHAVVVLAGSRVDAVAASKKVRVHLHAAGVIIHTGPPCTGPDDADHRAWLIQGPTRS